MMQKHILEAFVNEPQPIKTITLPRITLLERLHLKQPKQLTLTLANATARTMFKAALMILEYKMEVDDVFEIVKLNAIQHAHIIATVIHNHNSPLPSYLVDAVLDNFTNEELKVLAQEVYRRLDIENFFGSMALIRGLTVVKDTPEMIASLPSLETPN